MPSAGAKVFWRKVGRAPRPGHLEGRPRERRRVDGDVVRSAAFGVASVAATTHALGGVSLAVAGASLASLEHAAVDAAVANDIDPSTTSARRDPIAFTSPRRSCGRLSSRGASVVTLAEPPCPGGALSGGRRERGGAASTPSAPRAACASARRLRRRASVRRRHRREGGRLRAPRLRHLRARRKHLRRGVRSAGGHRDRTFERVRAKLLREPVEDYRIDFEDGYGVRSDAEEDEHAARAGRALARAAREGRGAPLSGVRVKSLAVATRLRAARTFDTFMTALLDEGGGALPPGFVVTLPKVEGPAGGARSLVAPR